MSESKSPYTFEDIVPDQTETLLLEMSDNLRAFNVPQESVAAFAENARLGAYFYTHDTLAVGGLLGEHYLATAAQAAGMNELTARSWTNELKRSFGVDPQAVQNNFEGVDNPTFRYFDSRTHLSHAAELAPHALNWTTDAKNRMLAYVYDASRGARRRLPAAELEKVVDATVANRVAATNDAARTELITQLAGTFSIGKNNKLSRNPAAISTLFKELYADNFIERGASKKEIADKIAAIALQKTITVDAVQQPEVAPNVQASPEKNKQRRLTKVSNTLGRIARRATTVYSEVAAKVTTAAARPSRASAVFGRAKQYSEKIQTQFGERVARGRFIASSVIGALLLEDELEVQPLLTSNNPDVDAFVITPDGVAARASVIADSATVRTTEHVRITDVTHIATRRESGNSYWALAQKTLQEILGATPSPQQVLALQNATGIGWLKPKQQVTFTREAIQDALLVA